MTTQNTHHEHSDADASFVEHQSVPDNTVVPPTSETVPSEGIEIQTGIPASDEPATPVELQTEATQETPTNSEPFRAQEEEQHGTSEGEDQPQNTFGPEATTSSEVMPDYGNSIAQEEAVLASDSDETSPPKEKEDEIRPFTDFIEEFRQAEEARLNASRQEIQNEPFEAIPFEPINVEVASLSTDVGTVAGEILDPIASTGVVLVESVPGNAESQSEVDLAIVAQQELVEEPAAPPPVVERAVSPLLRPATRLRVPRHGGRHIREEASAEKVGSPVTPAPIVADTETTVVPAATTPAEQATSTAEVAKEQEQPRPAR
ncbi:MAG TPA: hypothetical protein VII61_09070, partial [Ktedonobacteraceae bacterium]